MTLVSLAWRNLRRRPRRAVLAALGVSLGVSAYLVMVGLARGLAAEFELAVAMLGAEVAVQQAGVAVPSFSRIGPDDVAALARVPHVVAASPVAVAATRLPGNANFLVFGADPAQPLLRGVRVASGRMLRPRSGEIMIGRAAARVLDLAPGDRVELLRRHVLTVAGVYETGRGLLDSASVVDLADAQAMFRLGAQVSLVFLKVDTTAHAADVIATINASMPDLDASASDLWVSSHRQLDVVRGFARAFSLFAVAIAVLGIGNTLGMSVMERLTEIGVLRAVGWRRRRVALLVGLEAAITVGAGMAMAGPISVVVLELLERRIGVWFATTGIAPATLAESVALAVLAGCAGAAPALALAVGRRPAEALRSV